MQCARVLAHAFARRDVRPWRVLPSVLCERRLCGSEPPLTFARREPQRPFVLVLCLFAGMRKPPWFKGTRTPANRVPEADNFPASCAGTAAPTIAPELRSAGSWASSREGRHVYDFAMNIQGDGRATGRKARQIAKKILADEKLLG